MRRAHVALLAAMAIALLALAACGSNTTSGTSPSSPSTSSPSTARTLACNGLATVNQALASLASVSVSTTVGDVKAAQQKVTTALNAIEARIPSDSGDLLNQVKSANEQLANKIEGYPDNTPIGQTSAKVQDIKTNVATAQSKATALTSKLQCPS